MVEAALSIIGLFLFVFGAWLIYELKHPAVERDGKLTRKI